MHLYKRQRSLLFSMALLVVTTAGCSHSIVVGNRYQLVNISETPYVIDGQTGEVTAYRTLPGRLPGDQVHEWLSIGSPVPK